MVKFILHYPLTKRLSSIILYEDKLIVLS